MPLRDFPEVREMMLIPVPLEAWGRMVPDEARGGFPFVVHEVFWITEPVFHLLRVDGFTLAQGEADGVDDRTLLSHERITFEQIERMHYSLTDENFGGTIELTGTGRRIDLPVPLMDSYLNGGPEGYGRNPV